MPTASRRIRYGHLREAAERSSFEWRERTGELFEKLCEIGALANVPRSELDGFEGRFELSKGAQYYQLQSDRGVLRAWSMQDDGFTAVGDDALVLRACPQILLEKIAKANQFRLRDAVIGLNPMIGIADRVIDGKKFVLIIALDRDWITSFNVQDFVRTLAKDAECIMLLSELASSSFPWELTGKIHRRAVPLPEPDDEWTLPRDHFFDPSFGISTEAIALEYSDKKLIFDGVAKKIFVLGREIELKAGSRPFEFLRGVGLLAGNSAIATDRFASEYLGYHESYNANDIVRSARTQARAALKRGLDAVEFEVAVLLCMPETGDKTVKSGFRPDQVLILGSD